MRFFDDFTYEEMADELGFTLQQVKNAMHRAKRDLIELIELQAYDDVLHK
jgi:DNA-directed RNA polymerase specialized sigma24 family protein